MNYESGAAGVWAALTALAAFIAVTVTVGFWLYIYHQEATEIRPYVTEPCNAIQMILDDIPLIH